MPGRKPIELTTDSRTCKCDSFGTIWIMFFVCFQKKLSKIFRNLYLSTARLLRLPISTAGPRYLLIKYSEKASLGESPFQVMTIG